MRNFLCYAIIATGASLLLVSCAKNTSNPLVPAPTTQLSAQKVTPISATMQITVDTSTVTDTSMVVLLRGASASTLTDTVAITNARSTTLYILDSNNGKWLTPGGGYYYQSVELHNGAEVCRSAAVPVVLLQGDYYPLQIGSVWFYSGYVTDTITGAKITGSDFTSEDSLIQEMTFQGYSDVYMMQHSVYRKNTIAFDTLYMRKDASGHYWRWSQYGFNTASLIWLDMFRMDSTGVYTIHDTSEPYKTTGINVQETMSGKVFPSATVIVPEGSFTARLGVVNVTADVKGIVHDTIPEAAIEFSPGFGIVNYTRPSFLAKGSGLVKLPRAEGYVEVLTGLRIKY